MKIKRSTFLKIFSLLIIAICVFSAVDKQSIGQSAALSPIDLFEYATNCRKSPNPEEAALCGTVKSALPQETTFNDMPVMHPNPPAKGVTVCIYECVPGSPTCKQGGALTNGYTSTSTDENGYYYTLMRKVGGLQIRYVTFLCGGKLAGLFKIPSYRSFNLSVPVNCPIENSYSKCPDLLNPVSDIKLSCDIIRANQNIPEMPTRYEGTYSWANRPQIEYNFQLMITGADSRYLERGAVFGSIIDGLFNGVGTTPDMGAFYHEDCEMVYEGRDNVNRLCYGHTAENTGLDNYETLLYSEPQYTVMNFLPNIPVKNSLLFFKDLSARQDVVNYSQNPTAPAQLLHTIFSNCLGKVYLRKYESTTTDKLPDCELLKECNYGIPSTKWTVSNRQYTGGPAKGLANPAILTWESQATVLHPAVATTEVCIHEGKKVTIGQIQPAWEYCKIGTEGCDYVLNRLYWSPEFAYFFGDKGVSTLHGWAGEGSNDTPYTAAINKTAWTPKKEKADIPVKLGTYYSDNNYGLYRNNGLTPMLAGIAGNSYANTDYELSYVLKRPFEDAAAQTMYQQGVVKIEDAGSNLLSFCENSNVNSHNPRAEFTVTNEKTLLLNNFFGSGKDGANEDHYFSAWEALAGANRNKRTATSTVFLTTAANNRMQALANAELEGIGGFDMYDSLLTMGHGFGKYQLPDILTGLSVIMERILYGAWGKDDSKSYLDRENTYTLAVGNGGSGDLRDDLKVGFSLSEENFDMTFPLPYEWNDALIWNEDGHACYPWNEIDAGDRCYQRWGVTDPPNKITRTCKVEKCEKVMRTRECSCVVVDGNLVEKCSTVESTEDCSTNPKYIPPDQISSPILRCAHEKLDCWKIGGGWDFNCMGLDEPTASCPQDITSSEYWPCGPTWAGDCPKCSDGYSMSWNSLQYSDNESCPVYSSNTTSAYGCDMQDAGPYQCAGDLSKSSSFRTTQQTLRSDTPSVNLDPTITINNEFWKKFANPVVARTETYKGFGFQSTDTSVTGSIANKPKNTNKDVPAFGGASPQFKEIAAHPIPTNFYNGGMPIERLCDETKCPLLPVPSPEIISLSALETDPACSLQMDSSCLEALQVPSYMRVSPTFVTILNAAASKFEIDAAMLLAYLSGIHKFEVGDYLYLFSIGGEQALIEASAPWYGSISSCDVTDLYAIGPFDHPLANFSSGLEAGAGAALDQLSFGRSATASRCNFLDSAYVMAAKMRTTTGWPVCNGTWTTVDNAILTELFGSERVGVFGDDQISGMVGRLSNIYEACKD